MVNAVSPLPPGWSDTNEVLSVIKVKKGGSPPGGKPVDPDLEVEKTPVKGLISLRYRIFKKKFGKGKVDIDLVYPDGPNKVTNFIVFYK